jgi:hypothetical protein
MWRLWKECGSHTVRIIGITRVGYTSRNSNHKGVIAMPSVKEERVKIWNTLFKLAWAEAKSLYEATTGKVSDSLFDPLGGTLPEKEFQITYLQSLDHISRSVKSAILEIH